MPTQIAQPQPPRGLKRVLFRLPIWLYRLGLGWLLANRFLLINHIGRKSGLARQVVVEVVRHDEASDSYIVASGFGKRAQWYRNLLETPTVTIQIGRSKRSVVAEPLSPAAGAEEMADYARRHPRAARSLARFMGYQVDGSEEDYRALGKEIPFMALRPRSNADQSGTGQSEGGARRPR